MGENKFEHDYIYTSYPELMKKIKKKYGEVEASKLKIRTCDNHSWAHKHYFRNILKTKQSPGTKADYVIMTDRNLKYRKMNCFQLFTGEDIVSVERLGLKLSTLRKINTEEAREYMTHEWRLKNESWYEKWLERALKGEDPEGYIPLREMKTIEPEDREKLFKVLAKKSNSKQERNWLKRKFKEYKIKNSDISELKIRMDIVPVSIAIAQAAIESGWGTSRFALEGNALYGQWTWSDNGLKPLESDGSNHKVMRFKILSASI